MDCRSATKGLTALCLARLVDRGVIDVDEKVRAYWPELRCDATVRHAASHQAGIPIIDGLSAGAILDWDGMAAAIAAQAPMWDAGEKHGYPGVTFGWLVGEPVRRTIGAGLPEILEREVFDPLGVDGFMGTPPAHHSRMATLTWGTPAHGNVAAPPQGASAADPTVLQRMYAPVLGVARRRWRRDVRRPRRPTRYCYLDNASWAGPPGGEPRSARITTALYSCL